MTDVLTFAAPRVRFAPDIELSRGGDGRTVRGIIVPWDTPTVVDDGSGPYAEAFRAGAFDEYLGSVGIERVKFLGHHKRNENPLGRATLLRNDAAGQYAELYVSKTLAGDESLELIRDGVLDGFSVGFSPVLTERVGDVSYRTSARLSEVSLVTFPAYSDARVAGVRSNDLSIDVPDGGAPGAGEQAVSAGSGDEAPDVTVRGLNKFQIAAAVALRSPLRKD